MQNLTPLQSIAVGAIAGAIAPLSNAAVIAYNRTPTKMQLADIDWLLMIVCAVIGAVVAACLANGTKKQVFSYGVSAPFIVVSIYNSMAAVKSETKVTEVTQAVTEVRTTNNNNKAATVENSPPPLGAEAEQATLTSDIPAI